MLLGVKLGATRSKLNVKIFSNIIIKKNMIDWDLGNIFVCLKKILLKPNKIKCLFSIN